MTTRLGRDKEWGRRHNEKGVEGGNGQGRGENVQSLKNIHSLPPVRRLNAGRYNFVTGYCCLNGILYVLYDIIIVRIYLTI